MLHEEPNAVIRHLSVELLQLITIAGEVNLNFYFVKISHKFKNLNVQIHPSPPYLN